MTAVNSLTPDFVNTLQYTNKFLPNKMDTTVKKILKFFVIFFTLGLILIVPLTMDFSKKMFSKLFSKNPSFTPNLVSKNRDDSNQTNKSKQYFQGSSTIVKVANAFTLENITNTVTSLFDGMISISKTYAIHFSNPAHDRYKKIGFTLGITIPFWLAGGFVKGSFLSLLINGGGLAIFKIHEKIMTPAEKRE